MFHILGALSCDQTKIPLRSISGEGSLHSVRLKNSTVLELVFSASTANLAGQMDSDFEESVAVTFLQTAVRTAKKTSPPGPTISTMDWTSQMP